MNTDIFDSTGTVVLPHSIVRIINTDGGLWSNREGRVVCPDSDLEGQEYTVAVYFYREVDSHQFNHHVGRNYRTRIEVWDEKFAEENRRGQSDFLFLNDAWKQSPRVVFFRPEELQVIPRWSIPVLADRTFHDHYHHFHTLKEGLPQEPSAYMCRLAECKDQASDVALFNVWGTVCPIFVCTTCMPKVHGFCGDDLPQMKLALLDPKGQPILTPP